MLKKILILSGFIAFLSVAAQKTHTVAKGDNPYNIAKRYGMTMDELVKLNPKLGSGKLAIGDVLIINSKTKTVQKSETSSQTKASEPVKSSAKTGKIVLQPKQTLYGITKQYHITEADLRALNPSLSLKIGDEVVLPMDSIQKYGDKSTIVPVSQPEAKKDISIPVKIETDANSYTVQPKDNYYKITRQFNISQKQLFALNPDLEAKGLQPGTVIKINGDLKNAVSATVSQPVQEVRTEEPLKTEVVDDYVTYKVQEGDTVFGILNKFGIDLDDLLSLNPNLSSGLKAGMVLKIKKLDASYVKKSGDVLNVVLMLPFGFDTGDSKYRSMSLDFLTGAKLAIERNVRSGQKLDIKVIDAGNEVSFKNSLTQINQSNTDLIIGPFFKSNVKEVLDFVKSKNIPVVAPFANSADLYDYSNLIIVETNDNVYADRIVKEIKDVYSDQKIYIVADSDQSKANYIKSGLLKNLKNPNVVVVNSPSEIQPDQNMMTGKSAPVIAVLANDDDAVGTSFAEKMISLSKETAGIKAFSMYYSPIFEKKVDDLSQVNLVYLMDRKINTDGSFEKEILADYKSKYCKTPSKYSVVGFDVVNDMLTRENKKGEIFRQMNKVQTQLAGKFEFVRAKSNGAYVNTGYRVVRLVP